MSADSRGDRRTEHAVQRDGRWGRWGGWLVVCPRAGRRAAEGFDGGIGRGEDATEDILENVALGVGNPRPLVSAVADGVTGLVVGESVDLGAR